MPHASQQGAADPSIESLAHLVSFGDEMLCSEAGAGNPKKLVDPKRHAAHSLGVYFTVNSTLRGSP
ncbi:hypothetical protein D3C72_2569680 [compost metagenome]